MKNMLSKRTFIKGMAVAIMTFSWGALLASSESVSASSSVKKPNIVFIAEKETDEWLTDRLTSDAIDFMERHKDKPFFVNLHYYAPHRPSVPRSEEWLAHFMEKKGDPVTGQG